MDGSPLKFGDRTIILNCLSIHSAVKKLVFAQDPVDTSLWVPDDTSLYPSDNISLWVPDECELSEFKKPFAVVGVICIGITKSSCGFCFVKNCDDLQVFKWSRHVYSRETYKNPTSILTGDNGEFAFFGHDAEER